MRASKRLLACAVLIGVHLAAAPDASAQIPTVNTDGTLSDPAAPPPSNEPAPPPSSSEPTIITIGPDGKPVVPVEAEDPGQFYYQDDYIGAQRDTHATIGNGPVPSNHAVRRGDTLWDICWFYFNNPWEWPRVWSYNPEITNPHWIYPGDLVRLFQGGTGPVAETPLEPGDTRVPDRRSADHRGWFTLRQLAFVDRDNLRFAGVVAGSTDEKLLLATDDTIYVDYREGRPPQVGKRYAIYEEHKSVSHPKTGKRVGSYVKVIGEVEIVSVKKNKRARAIVTDAVEPIERGARVGPLQRQFRNVDTVASTVDLQGTIVAQLFADALIGARQVVFLDKGTAAGLRAGNRMFVVRRGDAYEKPGGRVSNRGQDDRRYPARAIGEVLVVQTGRDSSVAVVTMSIQELEVGDRVLMRKGDAGSGSGDE